MAPFERVESWVARQPAGRWRAARVRDGATGPVSVKVLLATMQAKKEAAARRGERSARWSVAGQCSAAACVGPEALPT